MELSQNYFEEKARWICRLVVRELGYTDEYDTHLHLSCARKLSAALEDSVKVLNSTQGSRKRKDLSNMKEALLKRGLSWKETEENGAVMLMIGIDEYTYHIRFSHGIDLAFEYKGPNTVQSFSHCTAIEEDIADLVLFIARLARESKRMIEEKISEIHKNQMLSDIELPTVELEVAHFLNPRGIRYTLEHRSGSNVLSIQIASGTWMHKSVTTDTLADDLQIIPYLIKRPDRIKMDGRGFKISRHSF